jgi:hypothetical protein
VALMCQDEHVTNAMEVAGSPCPNQNGGRPILSRYAALNSEVVVQAEVFVQAQVFVQAEVSAIAEKLFTRAEQAWFDRASN